jgi:hypothetical protein
MLRYTLLTDGSSDRALERIIDWVLAGLIRENGRTDGIKPEWADFSSWPNPPRGLEERVERTVESFPCDLLFIHRDAERLSLDERLREIEQAVDDRQLHGANPVKVIPVRMTEAWLLFDESAIRRAAGNPSSRVDLDLPKPNAIERAADPKQSLHEALRNASEYAGRRRDRFNVDKAVHRVAELIQDFHPLRQLPAFKAFEASTKQAFDAWVASGGGR